MCACGNATPTSLAGTRVFDVIKISNVKLFVDFIFARRGIIRNIRTFAPIHNFPLYGTYSVCSVLECNLKLFDRVLLFANDTRLCGVAQSLHIAIVLGTCGLERISRHIFPIT